MIIHIFLFLLYKRIFNILRFKYTRYFTMVQPEVAPEVLPEDFDILSHLLYSEELWFDYLTIFIRQVSKDMTSRYSDSHVIVVSVNTLWTGLTGRAGPTGSTGLVGPTGLRIDLGWALVSIFLAFLSVWFVFGALAKLRAVSVFILNSDWLGFSELASELINE